MTHEECERHAMLNMDAGVRMVQRIPKTCWLRTHFIVVAMGDILIEEAIRELAPQLADVQEKAT